MDHSIKNKFVFFKTGAVILALLFSLAAAAADYPEDVLKAKRSITGRMLVSHIHFLASKHCRGRDTGKPGMDVADQYITSVLTGTGASPAGGFGSYYQDVKLHEISLAEKVHLRIEERIGGTPLITNAELEADFLPPYISAEREVFAPVVFAGYGITAPEHNYDDYKNIDARGKIVLVMRHEPGEKDKNSPFDGQRNSTHGTLLTKIRNAQKHGAVGLLFVTDPLNHKDLSPNSFYYSGTYWTSLWEKKAKDDEDFKYRYFRKRVRLEEDLGVNIPVFHIHGKLAETLLGDSHSLRQIQKEIDGKMKPRSFALTGKKIFMQVDFNLKPLEAHNIVAKIEGSDPELKKEVVIVGAHYDHDGENNRGQYYPGADDNASGTAAVLELARAFQNLETKPKRTLLFILFTAEECGLLGSRYYTEHPIYPLEKTTAMINLDMIGRNAVDQLGVIGKSQYPQLFNLFQKINEKTANFKLSYKVESAIRNSDHFSFMRKKIPALFLSSRLHDEYHTPRDTAGLIVTEKVEKTAQLAFLTLWETANLPAGTDLKK